LSSNRVSNRRKNYDSRLGHRSLHTLAFKSKHL
jgi:hypothetical protein